MIEISVKRPPVNLPRELRKQLPFATALALTTIAKEIQAKTYDAMRQGLDRPTPFTMRSLFVTAARKGTPEATVGLKDANENKTGSTSASILGHLFSGGQRRYKRLEGALRRNGLIGDGMIAVPGSGAVLDAYGNLSQGQIVKLMSVIGLFGQQGYSANATPTKLAKMAKRGKTKDGYATINGVVYLVARGRGQFFGAGSWKNGRRQNLAPGIWAKSGIHGSSIKPILMFVRAGSYRQYVNLPALAQGVVSDRFDSVFRSSLDRAIGGTR